MRRIVRSRPGVIVIIIVLLGATATAQAVAGTPSDPIADCLGDSDMLDASSFVVTMSGGKVYVHNDIPSYPPPAPAPPPAPPPVWAPATAHTLDNVTDLASTHSPSPPPAPPPPQVRQADPVSRDTRVDESTFRSIVEEDRRSQDLHRHLLFCLAELE
jgi:hypothetical protein